MTYQEFLSKWQGKPGSFPRIVKAADYHDFAIMGDVVAKCMGTPVVTRELGMHDGMYVGVIIDAAAPEVLDHIAEDFIYNLGDDLPSP